MGLAAFVAATVLLLQPVTRAKGYIYPHYINGVILSIGALALLTIWLVRLARSSGQRKFGNAEICLAFFCLCALVQVYLSNNTRIALISAVNLIIPIIWGLLLARLLPGPRAVRFVARAVVAAGTLASLMAFFYLIKDWNPDKDLKTNLGSVEWVVGHRNFLAFFIIPTAILCVGELFAPLVKAKEGLLRFPWFITIPVALLVLVVTGLCGAIGGFMGITIGIGLLVLLVFPNWLRITLLAIGVVAVIGVFIYLSQPQVEARIAPNQQFQRWFLWKGAVKMFQQHPFVGWGPGMFQMYFADFKPTEPKRYGILTSITYHPHDEWLMIAVEHGLAGLTLFVGSLLLLFGSIFKKSQGGEDTSQRLGLWTIGAAIAGMLAHGSVEVAMRYWAPAAMFWTMVGVAMAAVGDRFVPRPARRPELVAIAALVGLCVAFFAWTMHIRPGMKAEYLLSGSFDHVRDAEGRVQNCIKARELSRYPPDYLRSFQLQAGFCLDVNDLDGAINILEDLEKIAPGYAQVRSAAASFYIKRLFKRGLARNADGDPDMLRAIEMFERSLVQNPWDPSTRIDMAQALMMQSPRNVAQAIEHARIAVEVAPNSSGAHLMLSTLLLDDGRAAESLEHVKLAEAHADTGAKDLLARIQYVKEEVSKALNRETRNEKSGT